jgi:hypothetical protein
MTHIAKIKPYKIPKKYYFKDITHQQAADILNKDYPINLKLNEDLVNRVHLRYSLISKKEVAIIIRGVFESMRELLLLGKVLNFNDFLMDLHFKVIKVKSIWDGSFVPKLTVALTTPSVLKD